MCLRISLVRVVGLNVEQGTNNIATILYNTKLHISNTINGFLRALHSGTYRRSGRPIWLTYSKVNKINCNDRYEKSNLYCRINKLIVMK